MTKKEKLELYEEEMYIFSGILFHNQKFADGKKDALRYKMDCPEYALLRARYALEEIAGEGGDFARSKRLLRYFAPKLTHSSWYDNHVPCNALALLEYSLDNPEHGINCLNKSKILEECCLAVGIYARRVTILPFSPYDFDNHVVTEIYDRKLKKWIMLDPTTNGFFVDDGKLPLSLLEIREKFANDQFVTFVCCDDSLRDLKKLREKHMDINAYICKNLFAFHVDQDCGFGESEQVLRFYPENYNVKKNRIGNLQFRINHVPEDHEENVPEWKARIEEIENSEEQMPTRIEKLQAAPCE